MTTVVDWLTDRGVTAAFIQKASPQQNCYVERFNGSMRDELLDGELFHSVVEARVVIGQRLEIYNHPPAGPRSGHDDPGRVRGHPVRGGGWQCLPPLSLDQDQPSSTTWTRPSSLTRSGPNCGGRSTGLASGAVDCSHSASSAACIWDLASNAAGLGFSRWPGGAVAAWLGLPLAHRFDGLYDEFFGERSSCRC